MSVEQISKKIKAILRLSEIHNGYDLRLEAEGLHLKLHKIDLNNLTDIFELEVFNNLYSLTLYSNELTEISSLPSNIKQLQIWFNPISSLELSNLKELEVLSIRETEIEKLDLSANTKLHHLGATGCNIKEIEVNHLKELEFLNLSNNKLTSLQIDNLYKLKTLNVMNNELTCLDISSNLQLKNLLVENNNLTHLDVSPLEKLEILFWRKNNFKEGDLVITKGYLLHDAYARESDHNYDSTAYSTTRVFFRKCGFKIPDFIKDD